MSFVIKDNAIQVIFIHVCRCDCKEGVGSLFQVALIKKKKNASCALWLELSLGFCKVCLPDCNSLKSAHPLPFELAVHISASVFYIMLVFLTTSPSGNVQK